jgi:hypothetical protein
VDYNKENKEKHAAYYNANREKILSRIKCRRTTDGDAVRALENKRYHEKKELKGRFKYNSDKERAKARSDTRRRSYLKHKEKRLAEKKERRLKNPMDDFIRKSLYRLSVSKVKCTRYERMLGYTIPEFRANLERQFTEGMSWDNRSEWHIDHIKPIKAFLDEGITDPAIINALDNLQPLWAHENLSKGAKWHE